MFPSFELLWNPNTQLYPDSWYIWTKEILILIPLARVPFGSLCSTLTLLIRIVVAFLKWLFIMAFNLKMTWVYCLSKITRIEFKKVNTFETLWIYWSIRILYFVIRKEYYCEQTSYRMNYIKHKKYICNLAAAFA